jgi:hypothetical protein
MGQPERERLEQNKQNKTDRTGPPLQGCHYRAVRTIPPGQDGHSRTAGAGQPGQDRIICYYCYSVEIHWFWNNEWKMVLYLTHTLLKTLAFPPSEWLWVLEPGFDRGEAKGRNSANSRFFAPGAFAFFAVFFLPPYVRTYKSVRLISSCILT